MKKIHRSNLIILLACITALAVTALSKYGWSTEGKSAMLCLSIGGICACISYFSRLRDIPKALGMLLSCALCAIVYSYVVGGSSPAFVALFMAMGMSSIYFDKRLIMAYAIPIGLVLLVVSFACPMVIEGPEAPTLKGALIKTVLFALTAAVLYVAAKRGAALLQSAEEMLEQIKVQKQNADRLSGELAVSLSHSLGSVHEVNDSTVSITVSVEQIQQTTEGLRDATLEVNSLIADAGEAVEENYRISEELEKKFGLVDKAVKIGTDGVDAFNAALGEMMQEIADANGAAQELLSDMTQIQGMLSQINKIASQTGMLSLNASIEAARAGESGKGFAVVASQIKELSEQSASASDSIGEVLRQLDDRVNLVSQRITAVESTAGDGMEKMKGLLEAFGSIDKNTEIVAEAVKGQYAVIGHVKDNFGNINKQIETLVSVSETNNESVLEISSSLEEQAASMKNVTADLDKINDLAQQLTVQYES